ncbi:MAG: hypothetical protein HFH90_07980 [Lachnospiraceae bacterium]|jgi:sugar lactone lactonase YvrE|nr:hypothetical protein [Lachnospiraceae bacterium]
MRKARKRIGLLLAGVVLTMSLPMAAYAKEGYTYNYDWWMDVQYSPDAYSVAGVFSAKELGLDTVLSAPEGLFVYDRYIYICDTGNNRILELEREAPDSLKVKRIIDSFKGGSGSQTFSAPTDVAVTEDGYIYISDKNNERILKLDMELNYVMEFGKPDDATFDQSMSFNPKKISVDSAGRVYCIAANVNKGLMKFEADGEYSGFTGASKVTFDWTDYVWKKLATKAQREQMESFVPTEYDNLYMDADGFIYVCTSNVSSDELMNGDAAPVRRLNMMGNNILVENGNYPVVGDLYFESGGGFQGPSLFTDVTAMENDIYVVLDKVRGRLFAYDDQGRLLYAFGGIGNIDGYFRRPVALDHMGRDLVVLDSLDGSVTVFVPTLFGDRIFDAIDQFQQGKYYESGETWREVLSMNGNFDLAYIGIGRSLLRQERYQEAMEYFTLKWDGDNYSKAFKQYRKEWVEEHILWLIAGFFLVLCVPLAIGKVKAIKHEIDIADIFRQC